MPRVLLIHWKVEEAPERVARLRAAGFRNVDAYSEHGGAGLPDMRANPPHAFVIDLSRLPSHGLGMATALRTHKATRAAPLVFVGGPPEKIERIRARLPDAVFSDWSRIAVDLKGALANPPAKPIVPAAADYSGTPLPKKLGVRPDGSVLLLGAPPGFERLLAPVENRLRVRRQARGAFDLVLLFVESRSRLASRLPVALRAIGAGGSLWIAWPKQASGIQTDLTQPVVRRAGLDAGVVDYKICAIDETWSGLRFARRRR